MTNEDARRDLEVDAYRLLNLAFNERTGRDLQDTDAAGDRIAAACGEVAEYLSYASVFGNEAHEEAKREAERQAAVLLD